MFAGSCPAAPWQSRMIWIDPAMLLLECIEGSNSSVTVPVSVQNVPQCRSMSLASPPGWMAPGASMTSLTAPRLAKAKAVLERANRTHFLKYCVDFIDLELTLYLEE